MSYSPSLPLVPFFNSNNETESKAFKVQDDNPLVNSPKDYYKQILIVDKDENDPKIIRKLRDKQPDKTQYPKFHFLITQYNKILEGTPIERTCNYSPESKNAIVIKLNTENEGRTERVLKWLLQDLKRKYSIDEKNVVFGPNVDVAKFYVVTMDSFYNKHAAKIVKWSKSNLNNYQIEHIKIPDNAGDNTINVLIDKLKPANATRYGVALLLIIGVHGNDVYYKKSVFSFKIFGKKNSENIIWINDLYKLKEINFIHNSVCFISACSSAREYEFDFKFMEGQKTVSFAREFSKRTRGYVTASKYGCSGQKAPNELKKSYIYQGTFVRFKDDKKDKDLSVSEVYTNDFYTKACENVQQYIDRDARIERNKQESIEDRKLWDDFKKRHPIKLNDLPKNEF